MNFLKYLLITLTFVATTTSITLDAQKGNKNKADEQSISNDVKEPGKRAQINVSEQSAEEKRQPEAQQEQSYFDDQGYLRDDYFSKINQEYKDFVPADEIFDPNTGKLLFPLPGEDIYGFGIVAKIFYDEKTKTNRILFKSESLKDSIATDLLSAQIHLRRLRPHYEKSKDSRFKNFYERLCQAVQKSVAK